MSKAGMERQSSGRQYQQDRTSLSITGGIGWGIGAYVLSLLGLIGMAAYGFSQTTSRTEQNANQYLETQYGDFLTALDSSAVSGEPILEAVLWAFYSGHGVPLDVTLGSETRTIGLLEAWSIATGVSTTAYLLVPACALALCGYVLARRTGATDPVGGAICGAAVGIGYGGLFLLGVPLSSIEGTNGVLQIGPATTDAVVRGIGYPLIGGGLGGVLAGLRG